jgi:hypothetical protein
MEVMDLAGSLCNYLMEVMDLAGSLCNYLMEVMDLAGLMGLTECGRASEEEAFVLRLMTPVSTVMALLTPTPSTVMSTVNL